MNNKIDWQHKINVFGIGGCGINIVSKLKSDKRLSKVIIDADIAHLNGVRFERTSVDLSILCGTGLGSGGSMSKGYEFAKESFSKIMYMFNNNQINLFICGLGGGSGAGITQFILKQLKKSRELNIKKFKKCYDETFYSSDIVLCTFPFDVEKMRIDKAKMALDELTKYCDLIILIETGKKCIKNVPIRHYSESRILFISDYVTNFSRLKNKSIIEKVNLYNKKSKIVRIDPPFDWRRKKNVYFNDMD